MKRVWEKVFWGVIFIFLFSILGVDTARAQAIKSWSQSNNAAQRFAILAEYGNEAVLDRTTGLIWERNVSVSNITWETARTACLGRSHPLTTGPTAGSFGWRLPKFEEIASLFASGDVVPTGLLVLLPSGHPFTGAFGGNSWTITESADGTQARVFNGTVYSSEFIPKTNSVGLNFWCVRGGAN